MRYREDNKWIISSDYYTSENDPDIRSLIKQHALTCDWDHSEGCGFLYDLLSYKNGRISKVEMIRRWDGKEEQEYWEQVRKNLVAKGYK